MPKKKPVTHVAKAKEEFRNLQKELVTQMVTLATSGFGLVSALAWNEAIQSLVRDYIQKYFPNSVLWSKFFYAALITFLAVMITYNLSRVASKLSSR